MDIYNLFWYSKEDAFFMNRWVPFRDVRGASPFTPAFERNVLMPFAKTFEGHTEELKKGSGSNWRNKCETRRCRIYHSCI